MTTAKSETGYLPLIQEDSATHSLAVYMTEERPLVWDLSIEKSLDFYFLWNGFTLLFFSLYPSPASSVWKAFYTISSTMDKVLSIWPYANALDFADFNVQLKDFSNYSVGTGRPGKLYYFLEQTFSDG